MMNSGGNMKVKSKYFDKNSKTWFIPQIYKWIRSLHFTPKIFFEPFAGGGIVSLTVANEGLADHVVMVEIDNEIAAVWKTVFYGDVEWLMHRIISFNMNIENVNYVLSIRHHHEKPFSIQRKFHCLL